MRVTSTVEGSEFCVKGNLMRLMLKCVVSEVFILPISVRAGFAEAEL